MANVCNAESVQNYYEMREVIQFNIEVRQKANKRF